MRIHPNGHVPRALFDPSKPLPWNLKRCACGDVCDKRSRGCRRCTRVGSTKWCSRCRQTKGREHFWFRKNGRATTYCKPCSVAITRERNRAGKRPPRNYKQVASRIQHRRDTDILFKLGESLRATVREAVKRRRGLKAAKTLALLGCSVEEFRGRIEKLWQPGMSWDNWGRNRDCWQIDHIRPVSSFDLRDPAQQRACFHFTNLQPLWALENNAKGNRLDWLPPRKPSHS